MSKRILWTSGKSDVDAMNHVGRDRPWCSDPKAANEYMGEGEKLYRIEIEEFAVDARTLSAFYIDHLMTLPKEGSGGYMPDEHDNDDDL